ncbi:MAG TPA: hypothetical protein PLV59_01510 [Candidatus Dojkabacteria bacterium]|nr:hypothetical protein [Candidatus Dojkabacteria bacterium]
MRYARFLELPVEVKKEILVTDIAENTLRGHEVPTMDDLELVKMVRHGDHYIIASTDSRTQVTQHAYIVIKREEQGYTFSVCRMYSIEIMNGNEDEEAVIRMAQRNTLGRPMTIENERKSYDSQHLFPTLGAAIQSDDFINMTGDDYEGILNAIFQQKEHRSTFEESFTPPEKF